MSETVIVRRLKNTSFMHNISTYQLSSVVYKFTGTRERQVGDLKNLLKNLNFLCKADLL